MPDASIWHEDAEYHVAPDDPDSGVAFPDLGTEIQEARAKRDKVFLWVRFVGRGAASGIRLEMELAHVCMVRDGRLARLVEYVDRGGRGRGGGAAPRDRAGLHVGRVVVGRFREYRHGDSNPGFRRERAAS